MKDRLSRSREEALRLFLTGEATTNTAIAARLKVKPRDVAKWRKVQDWKACKGRMLELAHRRLLEQFAPLTAMSANHLKVWGLMLMAMGTTLASQCETLTKQDLVHLEEGLATASRGIRLASA